MGATLIGFWLLMIIFVMRPVYAGYYEGVLLVIKWSAIGVGIIIAGVGFRYVISGRIGYSNRSKVGMSGENL